MQSRFLALKMAILQKGTDTFSHSIVMESRCSCDKFPIATKRPNSPEAMFSRSAIVILLFWKRPSAILGRIWTVVVSAINPMLRRWLAAHVSEEVFERIPAVAHCDASPAIVRELFVASIIAALLHCFPSAIFRCFSVSSFLPMCQYAAHFTTGGHK